LGASSRKGEAIQEEEATGVFGVYSWSKSGGKGVLEHDPLQKNHIREEDTPSRESRERESAIKKSLGQASSGENDERRKPKGA